jgi:hypothetical protein
MTTNLMQASAQWASRPADQRFKTLADLRASVHNRRMVSRSVDLPLSRIRAEERNGSIILNSGIAACEPSHWSFGQFSSMIGAPSNYLRKLPTELAVSCINSGIDRASREEVKFMTITDQSGERANTLQAVTSPTYGRIWDADCVDAVGRIVERTNGKFYNPLAYDRNTGAPVPSGLYASDRDVFMFMIDGGSRLEVGRRAKLNRGFFVWNSEVGSKTFGLMTFLFNEVCGNHIVWGAQSINKLVIRHSKNGPARFDSDAAPMLQQYAEASIANDEATIKRANEKLLPSGDELETLLAPFKFTKAETREAIACAIKEEGECRTLWDLVQGYTAYARDFDYVDARIDLEKRAGQLLNLVA